MQTAFLYTELVVLNSSGAARAYGCLSTSFSRLERDTRRRGAFSLYWDSNAFALVFILFNVIKYLVTNIKKYYDRENFSIICALPINGDKCITYIY